jgi:CopG family nickel-responsive transcriptional regulator
MSSQNDIVSVSLPKDLREDLDRCIEEEGYSGRSQAVRDGINKVVGAAKRLSSLDGYCSVLATFTYGSQHGSHRHDVKKNHSSVIQTHLHHCVPNGKCVDILLLEGNAGAVRSCVRAMRDEGKPESTNIQFL